MIAQRCIVESHLIPYLKILPNPEIISAQKLLLTKRKLQNMESPLECNMFYCRINVLDFFNHTWDQEKTISVFSHSYFVEASIRLGDKAVIKRCNLIGCHWLWVYITPSIHQGQYGCNLVNLRYC